MSSLRRRRSSVDNDDKEKGKGGSVLSLSDDDDGASLMKQIMNHKEEDGPDVEAGIMKGPSRAGLVSTSLSSSFSSSPIPADAVTKGVAASTVSPGLNGTPAGGKGPVIGAAGLHAGTSRAGRGSSTMQQKSSSRPVLEGHELGYILLEDCDDVYFVSSSDDEAIGDSSHIISDDHDEDDDRHGEDSIRGNRDRRRRWKDSMGWMDVEIPVSLHRDDQAAHRGRKLSNADEGRTEPSTDRGCTTQIQTQYCPHCYLYLKLNPADGKKTTKTMDPDVGLEKETHDPIDDAGTGNGNVNMQQSSPPLHRLTMIGDGPRFDGTVQGTKPNKDLCTCLHRPLQRSDAVLMMGVALTSHDFGHFEIQSIRVCRNHSTQSSQCSPTNRSNGARTTTRTAILMTFTCREIVRKQKSVSKSSPIAEHGKRRYITNSSKPLPPSTQLLLNLMSCDWDLYDAKILEYGQRSMLDVHTMTPFLTDNQRTVVGRKQSVPLFPSKMTLEGVYQRIQGVASGLDFFSTNVGRDTSSSSGLNAGRSTKSLTQTVSLAALPGDVLCHRIAPYLRSRSLDALRLSCRRLHWTLRGIVPGLKLELYRHQVKSLSWMRLRETTQIVESHLLPVTQETTVQRMINLKESDIHRAATGGGSVVLRPRDGSIQGVRISQLHGDELEIDASIGSPFARTVARGGLLCDDPGLGKTITVLSLILQTLGVSTECKDSERQLNGSRQSEAGSGGQGGALSDADERIFATYWKEEVVPEFRKQALTKLFNTFLRDNSETMYLFEHTEDSSDTLTDPICLKDVRKRINDNAYGESFATFQTNVELCFINAILCHPVHHIFHQAGRRLEGAFERHVRDFKEQQVQSAKKSFAQATRKPNSKVAALVVENNLRKLKSSLVPSSGTLLVVPVVLVDHWTEQLKMHVDPSYFTDKIPLIFEYTGAHETGLRMEEIMAQCQVRKTHYPYVLVDRTGAKKLPTPFFLAMFKIVITTSQRFSCEWKNGSFEEELRRQGLEDSDDDDSFCHDIRRHFAQSEESCPLLKVNWLRMIVDEGHSMGRGKDNSSISFASWINAERRWAMTGTPTRQNMTQSGLSNILNLMHYLKHNFFTHQYQGDSTWGTLVTKGWNRGYLSSFFRLRLLLSLLMVRHTKSDIEELSPPEYEVTTLPMSPEEVSTYNTLVSAAQSNLLITSMEGRTSGKQDSLLHKTQAKFARESITNLRLVCAGGTQVRPTLSAKNWMEFCRDFDACNDDPVARKDIRLFISRATTGQLSSCACCKMMLFTLLVFPCGHLVCTECVDNKTTSCVICEKEFDVDLFQKLQPGFEFNWLHNIDEEGKLNSPDGGRIGDNVGRNEHEDDRGGGGDPLMQGNMRTHKFGDGHVCVYNPRCSHGKCKFCSKEHENCYLVEESKQCRVCYRKLEECPKSETKSHYIIKKLHDMYLQQQAAKIASRKSRIFQDYGVVERRPLKAIIFSQFRSVLNMTGDRLLRRFGTGCVAEYWGMYRRKELHKFVSDEKCFCMILGKDGSEGLDLSFVTHIFFMEQVWEKGLESQAVARAWRMGAKGPVKVETLIAQNTLEETMASLERSLDQGPDAGCEEIQSFRSISENNKASEYQKAKVRHLLTSLNLITPASGTSGRGKRKAAEASEQDAAPGERSMDQQVHTSGTPAVKKRLTHHGVRFNQ